MQNIIRVATDDREAVEAGIADDLVEFVQKQREDFDHEIHYLHGPSVLVEFTFDEDVSKLAVLIKLVFGGFVEVALA
jgi:hypothetical protein